MVFPVVTYRYESWTIKAECWRTDAFKLWCWRRLFKVPWTARRSNQSILKEINPEYSLEGLMLKLKLQLIWPHDAKSQLIGKRPWCCERLRAGREGASPLLALLRWLDGIIHSMDMSLSKLQEIVINRENWYAAVHRVAKSQIWLSNWTKTN